MNRSGTELTEYSNDSRTGDAAAEARENGGVGSWKIL